MSPHRREVAPGLQAYPNMSRKSLEHHENRVNDMVTKNPDQESYIRARYANTYAAKSYIYSPTSAAYAYDSQDEVDAQAVEYQRYRISKVNVWSRIVETITTIITKTWYSSTSIFRSSQKSSYYRRVEEEKGNFFSFKFLIILYF